jgi:LCP family protein required for cell wall assembly
MGIEGRRVRFSAVLALVEYVVFHPWRAITVVVVGIVLGLGAFYGYQVQAALGAVAVEQFDPASARRAIEAAPVPVTVTPSTAPLDLDITDVPVPSLDAELAAIAARSASVPETSNFNSAAFGEPIADEVFDSYLLVGTDASGSLADTIILALQPTDGSAPIMVSLPRDLYVWNLCKQRFTRLNTGLGGCSGVASGSELLALMVEDYSGIPVDHLARINFDGFARVVDAMGGIRVCIDNPMRDSKSHLDLPSAGCQVLGGAAALAWVRSRHPEELVGETWRAVGGSDFGRQRRQQDVLFQLAGKASGFSSPGSLANKLSAVASTVRLDSSWSFASAVGAAWRYRGISKDDVVRFSIDVGNFRTSQGQAVLLPSVPFADHLGQVYDLS